MRKKRGWREGERRGLQGRGVQWPERGRERGKGRGKI